MLQLGTGLHVNRGKHRALQAPSLEESSPVCSLNRLARFFLPETACVHRSKCQPFLIQDRRGTYRGLGVHAVIGTSLALVERQVHSLNRDTRSSASPGTLPHVRAGAWKRRRVSSCSSGKPALGHNVLLPSIESKAWSPAIEPHCDVPSKGAGPGRSSVDSAEHRANRP